MVKTTILTFTFFSSLKKFWDINIKPIRLMDEFMYEWTTWKNDGHICQRHRGVKKSREMGSSHKVWRDGRKSIEERRRDWIAKGRKEGRKEGDKYWRQLIIWSTVMCKHQRLDEREREREGWCPGGTEHKHSLVMRYLVATHANQCTASEHMDTHSTYKTSGLAIKHNVATLSDGSRATENQPPTDIGSSGCIYCL